MSANGLDTTGHNTEPQALTAYTKVGNATMGCARPLPRRLLGVWAHPDDEAYLSAGLMARVVRAGGQVTVITATRGEKGTDDPDRYDTDQFGAYRELELRTSLATLGVTDVRFLGLRDGECEIAAASSTANAALIDAIGAVIDEIQPDAIVTFGPDGMTNHPDHLAISRWTTAAWAGRWAGDIGNQITGPTSVGDLLYATVTNEFAAQYREMHDQLGVFADFDNGQPQSVSRSDVALSCSLTETELDDKRLALAAHHSQTAGLAAAMGEEVYRIWYRDETFRRPTRSELLDASCFTDEQANGASIMNFNAGPAKPAPPILEVAA